MRNPDPEPHRKMMIAAGILAFVFIANAEETASLETRLHAIDHSLLESSIKEPPGNASQPRLPLVHSCFTTSNNPADRSNCAVLALFAEPTLRSIDEPSALIDSTLTGTMLNHRGTCAALAAVALSVADAVGVQLEAWVRADHVVVAAPGADGYFELLQNGAFHPWGPNGHKGWTRVKASDFPGYYLDNLAVRMAEAHDARAEATFQRAIAETPKAARLHFNYGTFLLNQKRNAEATAELKRATSLDGENADAWTNLGVAYSNVGDTAKARRCFEKALRIDPKNANARRNLAAMASSPPTK